MKRKLSLLLLIAILLTACNTNNLAEYKKAVDKTDQITKGQTLGEFTLITEFNQEGLTAEEIRELNYIKDMNGSFSVVFDDEEEKSIIRNYFRWHDRRYARFSNWRICSIVFGKRKNISTFLKKE